MEFEQYNNAKRSLLKNCEEGKDYVVLLKEAKIVENSPNDPDAEIFKLYSNGFQLFLLTAQKPMAKVFARLMIDMMNQRREFYLKVNSGVAYLSEKANLMGDVEESIHTSTFPDPFGRCQGHVHDRSAGLGFEMPHLF